MKAQFTIQTQVETPNCAMIFKKREEKKSLGSISPFQQQ